MTVSDLSFFEHYPNPLLCEILNDEMLGLISENPYSISLVIFLVK